VHKEKILITGSSGYIGSILGAKIKKILNILSLKKGLVINQN